MADHTFTFGGTVSSTYGIYISGEGVFNAPERAVEMVTIPGKDGALVLDQGRFENIQVTYPAFNYESDLTTFRTNLANLRNALCSKRGYQRLADTIHPDEFRLGVYHSGLEITPIKYNTASTFNIIFDCKPQRFLVSGETATTLTASGTITNPTQFDSKPLITITGTGTVTVNGVAIAVTASPTTIDCETMEAYNGTTSRNGTTTLSPNRFPVLSPGSNTITKTSGITQIRIVPRWWRI